MDITRWNSALWCVMMLICPGNAQSKHSFTGVSTLIREIIGRTTTEKLRTVLTRDEVLAVYPGSTKQDRLSNHQNKQTYIKSSKYVMENDLQPTVLYATGSIAKSTNLSDLPDQQVTAVQFVEKPTGVKVTPLPLAGSDHELSFNVTWDPPIGQKVQAYSLEVHSETNTIDCRLANFCYETNIPGDAVWSLIPAYFSPDADGCAVRPGCAYWIKLIASPWDGHSYADLHVELDECVEGVCSCAHAPRLPAPVVSAKTISIHGDLFVNVTWSLPVPTEPLRLPPRLKKQYYLISIGKEIGRAWHPHIVTRRFDAFGFVVIPETFKWRLLPVNERGGERSGARISDGPTRSIVLDVKLIARVSLVDERGCTGPAGNSTAYDPSKPKTPIPVSDFQFQALWAVFGGACVLAMVAILAFSARAVKRVLKEFRHEPAPATLQPLRPRLSWFPQDAYFCYFCGEEDTPRHAISECPGCANLRAEAQGTNDAVNAQNLVKRMLSSEDMWSRYSQMLRAIMMRREEREKKKIEN